MKRLTATCALAIVALSMTGCLDAQGWKTVGTVAAASAIVILDPHASPSPRPTSGIGPEGGIEMDLKPVEIISDPTSAPTSTDETQPSVTGSWYLTKPSGSFPIALNESGGRISGTATVAMFEFPISGYRQGNTVTFTIDLPEKGPVIHTGDISQAGQQIKGFINGDTSNYFVAVKKS